jgi:hypothetical protein
MNEAEQKFDLITNKVIVELKTHKHNEVKALKDFWERDFNLQYPTVDR